MYVVAESIVTGVVAVRVLTKGSGVLATTVIVEVLMLDVSEFIVTLRSYVSEASSSK